MTARSTRRAAEQAVINAAVEWHHHRTVFKTLDAQVAITTRLHEAVEHYEALGLEAPGEAITGHNNPHTSHDAAASLDSLGQRARQVFDEIAYSVNNGSAGLTCDQIEQLLNRSHQAVSARVNELRDKGWVVDSGVRRKTRSGRNAIVWRPSALADSTLGRSWP